LFRSTTFLGANIVFLLVVLAMFGVLLFVSLYLQNILLYSPVKAGAAFLPMTIAVVVVAPLAGRASDRLGSRWLMTFGLVLVAGQLLYLSRLGSSRATGPSCLRCCSVASGWRRRCRPPRPQP
jgi:predicted MFS family arabinose efflux permease